uniref:Uncharacterized protein n=1 Tax=Rhizophora mucronata TaxID=61149 RepID=A0A2P2QUQ3_RHIMU
MNPRGIAGAWMVHMGHYYLGNP